MEVKQRGHEQEIAGAWAAVERQTLASLERNNQIFSKFLHIWNLSPTPILDKENKYDQTSSPRDRATFQEPDPDPCGVTCIGGGFKMF